MLDGAGEPVPDAVVELYQADAAGRYPDAAVRAAARSPASAACRPASDGCCVFQTIKPGAVRTNDTDQAPHINVCLLARGLLRQIYTRIYFTGDPALATRSDPRARAGDRRATLLARSRRRSSRRSLWEFVIRMQGGDETVFFDL